MGVVMRFVLLGAVILGLTGCYRSIATPDLLDATVRDRGASTRALTQQQLSQLSSWFKAHVGHWEGLTETPPAPMTMELVMIGPDGWRSSMTVFESKDGKATAYFYASASSPPLKRRLSRADLGALSAAVDD
jgi:hypothetical protein